MTVEQIAEVCHEANAAYCRTIGDVSQPLWKDAPEWQRASALKGVKFHLDNPEATPANSHEEWLKEKKSDGWSYGPIKVPTKKLHPCCVPYDELPEEHKLKDTLFMAVITALK